MSETETEAMGWANLCLKKVTELRSSANQKLKQSSRGYSLTAERTAREVRGHFEQAAAYFGEVLSRFNTNNTEAMAGLADIRMYQDRPKEAVELLTRALSLLPDSRGLCFKFANAHWDLGDVHKATEYFHKVCVNRGEVDLTGCPPDGDVLAIRNIGQLLLLQANYAEGWRQWDLARGYLPVISPRLWQLPRGEDGSAFEKKSVVVIGEQGIGDEVMYASCIPDLSRVASECTVACDPRLHPIFGRSFDSTKIKLIDRFCTEKVDQACSRADVVVAIGSLPRYFRQKESAFPRKTYLRADAGRVQHWHSVLEREFGRCRKIGLSWRGGRITERNGWSRTLPPDQINSLSSVENAVYINLQHFYDPRERELAENGVTLPVKAIPDIVPEQDVDDLAALITALDLIVSVDNANVHLAGALGQRVMTLLTFMPDWRWGATGERSVWYPAVELIRQHSPGDWGNAVERLLAKLKLTNLPGAAKNPLRK